MKNWNDKPYHSFDYMLKERFHGKVYKVALNGGMTCPNRDGTLGNRGCIFCSAGVPEILQEIGRTVLPNR